MGYLRRTVDIELDQLIHDVPAIALDGPKGVGKTGTAQRRAVQAWYLDDPLQSQRLELDFGLETIAPEGTVLIDEWQRLPQVWDSVRRRVDRGAPGGRFLLTGSATPSTKEGTHSGAGRIMSLRMRPMGLHERGKTQPTVSLQGLLTGDGTEVHGETDFSLVDYVEAIVESGFPGAMDLRPRARKAFLDAYLERVIDRDLPDLGHQVRRPRCFVAGSGRTLLQLHQSLPIRGFWMRQRAGTVHNRRRPRRLPTETTSLGFSFLTRFRDGYRRIIR